MSDARLWLAGLVALPALVIGASFLRLDVERLRRLAVARRRAMLLAALVIAVSPGLRALLDPHLRAQLGSRRRGHRSHRHALGRPLAVRGRSVAAHRRGDAARRARSRRIAPDGPRHAHHARILSHRERGRAPALVGGLRLDVPVRAGGPGASVSAPHRGGVSGLLDAALWRRRRAARRSWRPEHDDRNGGHVVDRDRGAGAERDRAVPRVGAGGVRSRTAGAGHSVQRTAGGRVHDRGADRAARLARHAADDRHPGARDGRVRRGARARPDQCAPGVRVPVHESVRAGDGGPRLHERRARWRAGCWCGCRPGWRLPDSPAASSSSKRAAGGSI